MEFCMLILWFFLLQTFFTTILCQSCFGISSDNSNVCSGHGECIQNNTCVCEESDDVNYKKPKCEMELKEGPSFVFDNVDSVSLFLGIPVCIAFVCVYFCCCSCLVYVLFFFAYILCKRQKIQKEVDYLESFDFREDHQEYYNLQMEGVSGLSDEEGENEDESLENKNSQSEDDNSFSSEVEKGEDQSVNKRVSSDDGSDGSSVEEF